MHQEIATETAKHREPLTVLTHIKKIRWWAIAAIVIIAGGLLAVAILHVTHTNAPAALSTAQRAVEFPIYYSAQLPPGFSLDTSSISYTKNVVLFSYLYENGKRATVSIQPRTASFTADEFKPTSDFTTFIGRAYVVDLDDRSSAAVVGDKSWVLINAPDKIPADTLRQLIDSLRPLR